MRGPALLLFLVPTALAFGQSPVLTCAVISTPALVRAEGLTERLGDVQLNCTGGSPHQSVAGNLTLFLSVNVTNRITPDNFTDVGLTVDSGSGPEAANVAGFWAGANIVAFNGLRFNLSASGTAFLNIFDLRGAANRAAGQPIVLSVSFSGALISPSQVKVGQPLPSLLAASAGRLICSSRGSPLPDTIAFSGLIAAGTAFASTRVTEGFASAFAPRADSSNLRADSGLRILVTYAGFPAGARLFIPDAVVGSDGMTPTAGGDLGFAPSGGRYSPGNGELLLLRVQGVDSTGAGGMPVFPAATASAGVFSFDSASEVMLSDGIGYAVYEVADANPSAVQSAQFPTFLELPAGVVSGAVATTTEVTLAPESAVATASTAAPVPRFVAATPPLDCNALGDCTAPYFPSLFVDASALSYTTTAGAGAEVQYVPVRNQGGGLLQWVASVTYTNGSGWLRLDPATGTNNGTVRVDALPGQLAPGAYGAQLRIDAGPLAGARIVPVTLQINPAPPPAPAPPAIDSVTNAASEAPGPLVAGSLATIKGSHLGGASVSVAMDGVVCALLYASDTQINLQVPAQLAGEDSALLMVTAGGTSSAPFPVSLAPVAPAIFPGGVLNQDSTPNGPNNPALVGSVIQVFATGLSGDGIISGKIHDRVIDAPYYGGPAPGLRGIQQVNLVVPADLPAMMTFVYVCGAVATDPQNRVCSPAVPMYIAR